MSEHKPDLQRLGKPQKLIEGMEKVTGRTRYVADLNLPGMLHARPVLSPYAHARITGMDLAAARAVPGVVAVLTATDLPTYGRVPNSRQTTVLADTEVVFRGEPVVVVVAESETAASDGIAAVMVDYEPLPTVADMDAALSEGAPLIWPEGLPQEGEDLTAAHAAVEHGEEEDRRKPSNVIKETHFSRGDVQAALVAADVVVDRSYTTATVHQGYMEPHAVVADPDPLGKGLTVYTSTQGQFGVRNELARLLGLPRSKVVVVPMTVGGGFGAKYGILEPLVAATALALSRPVRMVLTRTEDFLTTTPSPASRIDLKLGATRDGKLTALHASIRLDNGVYPFPLGGIVSNLIGGYYKCDNVQIDCYEVVTHKSQAGAYRAPGAPQATFALESSIDDVIRELGTDPLQFRLNNAAEGGDPMGTNAPWPHIGLKPVLQRLAEHPLWQERRPGDGTGIAVGGWPCGMSPAAAVCRPDTDGTIRVHVGSVDISGVNSTFALIAAEVFDVDPEQIEIIAGDTRNGPHAGPSGGSQITYSVGGAVAEAAQAAKRQLLEVAVDHFEARIEDLEMKNGNVQVRGLPGRTISVGELASIAQTRRGGPGPVVGEGRSAVSENAPGFVAHLVKVEVDRETGRVQPLHYVAIQDVGFALNPLMVEGQIHGGSAQGIGYGLYEALRYDEHGELLSASFMDYDLPRADQLPTIEAIMVQNPSPHGPFGARGVGEPPITAGPAALANAIRDAVGVRVTELPLREELIWWALQQ